jgi:epoxide hydrolase 4
MRINDLEVTHAVVQVNGLRMHYVEKGQGPLVVLLHGFPENWWSWRYQIEPLARAGFRVIAPDLRGYNETEKKGPYDLDTLAQDIVELIGTTGESSARIVGHDWGGAVAWHLASMHPEVVERLVVMNCPHPALMERALRSRWSQLRRSWYMFFFQLPWIPERQLTAENGEALKTVFRRLAIDPAHFNDEDLEPIVRGMLEPGAATAALGYYRAAMRQALLRPGSVRKPSVIQAPTMLLWAMDDKALGYDDLVPGTERWVRSLRVEPIDRCGHFVQSERPNAVNDKLIGFLQERTVPPRSESDTPRV